MTNSGETFSFSAVYDLPKNGSTAEKFDVPGAGSGCICSNKIRLNPEGQTSKSRQLAPFIVKMGGDHHPYDTGAAGKCIRINQDAKLTLGGNVEYIFAFKTDECRDKHKPTCENKDISKEHRDNVSSLTDAKIFDAKTGTSTSST